MKIVKTLCVVLHVYSACFGECRTLERRSNLKKRMQAQKTPKEIAQELEKLVRRADKGLKGKNQFGYIYIQPTNSDKVTFDNSAVYKALVQYKNLPNYAYNAHIWPTSPLYTNFRMAVPDYYEPKETNYGHAEYQLLTNNGLNIMLETFKTKHNGCPKYVILYSTILPCLYPPNPVKINQPQVPRCAEMTVNAKNELKGKCLQTEFFVYSNDTTTYEKPLKEKVDYLEKNGIILLNIG